MSYTFYVIGEDPILIQCLDILMLNGHKMLGIVSKNSTLISWCHDHQVDLIGSKTTLAKVMVKHPCDYLILLDHSIKPSMSLCKNVKKQIIVFRNTLLKTHPKYAPAQVIWSALKNNQVAWCVLSKAHIRVDVVADHEILIHEQETTSTLTLKIYESAILLFRNMIHELPSKNLYHIKQDCKLIPLHKKNYIQRQNTIINWHFSAEDIYRLYRALQFSSKDNPIGILKFFIDNICYIPNEIRLVTAVTQLPAGYIVEMTNNHLQISTAHNDIRIYSVLELTGRSCSIKELIDKFKLFRGRKLTEINTENIAKINSLISVSHKQERFWIQYLNKITPLNILPTTVAQARLADKNMSIRKVIIKFSKEFREKINKIFGHDQIEIFLLSVVLVYLFRINNYETFSINLKGLDSSTNTYETNVFAKYIPFLCDFDKSASSREIISYLNQKFQLLIKHHSYILDLLLRYPHLFEKTQGIKQYIGLHGHAAGRYYTIMSYQFGFTILKDKLQIHFFMPSYLITDLRNQQVFDNIKSHIKNVAKDMLQNPQKPLYELSILSKAEMQQILIGWNNTHRSYPSKRLLHELFQTQAVKTPHHVAVIFKEQYLNYRELNNKSNQLARYLRNIGVKNGNFIAVILDRSINMIIAILGALKAGGAYVPIAPSLPLDRIYYILKNNCTHALTDDTTPAQLKMAIKNHVKNVDLTQVSISTENFSPSNLNISQNSEAIAYVLYTSGTTGGPKGVQVSHRAIVNHMCWMKHQFNFSEKDIILQKTPFTFDASVWEFFMPILSGGKLVFAANNAQISPILIIKQIRRYKITTLQLVPSMLRELLKQEELKKCNSLRQIFSGGELLTPEIKQAFFKTLNIELHNLYGPTEATIEVTSHTCKNIPGDIGFNIIGKPIDNTQIYILDIFLNPMPACIVGELYIGGDCLSTGYVNNAALTNKKFITNHFSSAQHAKLYKTGDLARWLPDGNLEIIGRTDDQVKIRGFRIELAEIENSILLIPDVKQCAVIVKNDKLGFALLVAYVALNKTSKITTNKLKSSLYKKLPEYMIPSIFVVLNSMPLTNHGKIDRKNLPDPNINQIRKTENYISPSSEAEKILAGIWKDILNIDHIGIEDDFFTLGGHSLSVLHVLSEIRNKLAIDVSIKDFVDNSTISKLCKNVVDIKNKNIYSLDVFAKTKSDSPIITLKSEGAEPPLFLIHPVGGTIFWYILLSKYLTTRRPIYAIQDPGISEKDKLFETIEKMASYYLTFIRKIQPHGPYLIGGASFGSTVAIEAAQQLQQVNEQTIFIPVLDGWAIYPDTLKDLEIFKETMDRQYMALSAKLTTSITNNAENLLQLQQHRLNMLWKYKIKPITHKLTLFKCQEIMPVFQTIDSDTNHWEKYVKTPLNKYEVPGNHETMFQEPHVRVLAQAIDDSLKKLDL